MKNSAEKYSKATTEGLKNKASHIFPRFFTPFDLFFDPNFHIMKFESEVVSEELLPAIRSIMASQLKQEYGLKQKEIADKIDITQPAVSQYLSGNRANQKIVNKMKDDPQIEIIIRDAVSNAAKDQEFSQEISQAIQTVRDKGLLKEKFSDTEKII